MNSIVSTYSSSEQIKTEIQERMGICPSFFLLAEHSPEIMGSLWQQAQVAYLDNPLPSMFKEKLFTYLSRFCSSPYCMARHSAFLTGRGHVSGDPDCSPLADGEVTELLARPVPSLLELQKQIEWLEEVEEPITEVPVNSLLEQTLVSCSAALFLFEYKRDLARYPESQIKSCKSILNQRLGNELFQNLVVLLSYIRSAHFWTSMHSELPLEEDVVQLLNDNPALARWVDSYSEIVETETIEPGHSLLAEAQQSNEQLLEEIARQVKRAETTESAYRQISEDLNGILWKCSVNPIRFQYVSENAERTLGYPVQRWIEEPDFWANTIVDDDRERAVSFCMDRTTAGHDHQFQYQMKRADGEVIWISDFVRLVRDNAGELTHLQGIMVDITAQKDAERRARESESRMRTLFESGPECVKILDSKNLLIDMNSAGLSLIDAKSLDQVVGKSVLPMILPEYRANFVAVGEQVFQGKHAFLEYEIQGLSGHRCCVESYAAPLRNDEGAVVAQIAVTRDITKQKESQAALLESESRFRAIFEQAAVGVAQVETRTGRFLHVNQRYADIIGCSVDELIATDFRVITHPDDLQENLNLLQQLRAGEIREYSIEKRYFRKDGSIVWVALTVSPFWNIGEEPDYHIAVVEDISVRVAALESLKANKAQLRELNRDLESRVYERTAELIDKNQELEGFAHNISHDLRAPLRAMEGFSTALSEDFHEQLGTTGNEFVQHIRDAARHMDHMINDLLSYSRLGRAELNPIDVELGWVVRQAMDQHRTEISDRQAQIEIDDDLRSVVGHRSTLVQIVANLLGNALKFVPSAARPNIRIWSEARDDQRLRLWIKDNGIGIDPEYQQRIFRVFERLHGIESYPGTGIGLAIVARGCERLGGDCGVVSETNNGSAFWIEFPRGEIV